MHARDASYSRLCGTTECAASLAEIDSLSEDPLDSRALDATWPVHGICCAIMPGGRERGARPRGPGRRDFEKFKQEVYSAKA